MTDETSPVIAKIEQVAQGWLVAPLFFVARVAVIAMCLATMADIVGRRLFGLSVPGIVELVEFALVWSALAGIAVAFWTGAHVSVELIGSVASRGALAVLDAVKSVIALAVMAWLAWLAVVEFADKLEWGDRTMDLSVPYSWYWGAVVVGYAAAAFILAARTIADWRSRPAP